VDFSASLDRALSIERSRSRAVRRDVAFPFHRGDTMPPFVPDRSRPLVVNGAAIFCSPSSGRPVPSRPLDLRIGARRKSR